MKNLIKNLSFFSVMILLFFQSASAAEIKVLDEPQKAEAQLLWRASSEVTPPAEWSTTEDGKKITKLNCPFATLKDWRVCWDKQVSADLSTEDQIVLLIRTPDPEAVASVIIYFKSGRGWYTMSPFGITSSWQTVVLKVESSGIEDSPSGWNAIDAIRIGILPAEKRDTYVELKQISARKGWPASYMGMIGPYSDLKMAVEEIKKKSRGISAEKDIDERLDKAAMIKEEVDSAKDWSEKSVQEKIIRARELLSEAYALIQTTKSNEFRGFWAHNGDGIRSMGSDRAARWKEAIPMIKSYGFNAIFPNMLWSGVAFYKSKIVPNHPGIAEEGDYLQEIIDAAKASGIDVHAWKVMWQFSEDWLAQSGVSEPFRREGRLQKNSEGKEVPWLCPSDPRNQQIELDATLEMAKYDIQGIHLDYIRYNGDDVCYCDGCRTRFEKQTGKAVKNWPYDVIRGGIRGEEYAQWKRDQITHFVKTLREKMKKKYPKMKLSAAVFSQPEQARNFVFQDWVSWANNSLLDFVCTMTYTDDLKQFQNTVKVQVNALKGTIPLYVGMMVSYNGRPLALDTMVDEILATRDLGAKGFVFFELNDYLQDSSLPYLKAGLTRKGEYNLSFREIPENQRPAKVTKGEKLRSKKDGIFIDDFEDGDSFNAFETSWKVDFDSNGLGTVFNPSPFVLAENGANGSKYCARIWGHYGKSKAPWPWALLYTELSPSRSPVDLDDFNAIELYVKGDGKLYEISLIKQVVKDYAHFRQSFIAPKEWTLVVLPIDKFNQPNWGKREEKTFSDVTSMQIGPSGMDDEDFDLSVDNIRLVK